MANNILYSTKKRLCLWCTELSRTKGKNNKTWITKNKTWIFMKHFELRNLFLQLVLCGATLNSEQSLL